MQDVGSFSILRGLIYVWYAPDIVKFFSSAGVYERDFTIPPPCHLAPSPYVHPLPNRVEVASGNRHIHHPFRERG